MRLLLAVVLLALVGCRCGEKTMTVKPVISIDPTSLDFKDAKVGKKASLKLTVRAAANATLHLSGFSVAGDMAFGFENAPESVPGLGEATVDVTLTPTEVRGYSGELVIASDDEEHAEVRVALTGQGAVAEIAAVPQCTAPCMAAVTATTITFAPEPAERAVEPPVTIWPVVRIDSIGKVPLEIAGITIEGTDAAAFSVLGAMTGTLNPMEHADVPLKFDPNAMQTQYAAELVIRSDAPAKSELRIPLSGELRANLPPVVCANIIRVRPGDGSQPIDYSDWSPAPDAGYDFTRTREVQPNSIVELSAWSSADPLTCTTDPEDERIALTYLWEVIAAPPGPPAALTGATTANARFAAAATGTYSLRLTVQDVQGHATATQLTLLVALKQDLVAQLSWTSTPNVDLDLHLVRPGSSPFSFFAEGTQSRTSGDLNGWAQLSRMSDAGFDFEWGDPGAFDDPRLNIDDTGSGALLENASLNYPDHAAACSAADCTYQVLVHYFRDARDAGAPSTCSVSGCRDGEACNCPGGQRCVANLAPIGDAGSGPGICHESVKPVLRVFVRADPVPAAVIPLDTLMPADPFGLGAPCELWHVANVTWPRRGADAGVVRVEAVGRDDAGYLTAPSIERYGYRPNASGQCAPNVTRSGRPWYAP